MRAEPDAPAPQRCASSRSFRGLDQGLLLKATRPVRSLSFFSSSLSLPSLELGDTKVYEPYIRALLATAAHFCLQPCTPTPALWQEAALACARSLMLPHHGAGAHASLRVLKQVTSSRPPLQAGYELSLLEVTSPFC